MAVEYKGKKIAMSVKVDAPPTEEKTVEITENGAFEILPSSGKTISKVTGNANVQPSLQEKTVTPTKSQQIVKSDNSYDGLSQVTVNKIPDEYIIPSGSQNISENGTFDVTSKASVVVNVPSVNPTLNAPSISLDGSTLTITNPSSNGNFVTGYKVFNGSTLLTTITSTTVDLKTVIEEYGTYTITVKAVGTNFNDSAASNSVEYEYAELTLQYYGTATELSATRRNLAATTIGNYALFGGGYDSNGSAAVDAYDTSLTRTIPTELSVARRDLAATSIGNYALFGGGASFVSSTISQKTTVDAYDTSLTRTIPTELSVARYQLVATTVGNYALFGGGEGLSSALKTTVDAYDTSLTRTEPTALSVARRNLAATSIGNYALFGGGYLGGKTTVDAYDTSLTRTIPTALSQGRGALAATTVGNYALFGGGGATVDAYDASLTRTIPTALSQGRSWLAATTVGNYALFGGGSNSAVVDAYDASLTRTIPTALSQGRGYLAATTVGNYALFGGGYTGSNSVATVDAYTVA